jgi:hypothetical protein
MILGMVCLFALGFPSFAQDNQIPFEKIRLTPRTAGVIKDFMILKRERDEDLNRAYDISIMDRKVLRKRSSRNVNGKTDETEIPYEYDLTWNANAADRQKDDFLLSLWWNEQVVETFCFDLPKKGAGTYIKTFYSGSGDRMWCEFGEYAVIK